MAIIEWSWHPPGTGARPVGVRIRCDYPGTELEPTVVEFQACRSLGRTSLEVDAEILRRLVSGHEFELPAVGERWPLPFASATVRRIVVRQVR